MFTDTTAATPQPDIGELRRTVTVRNPTGLHARPAANIVRIGNKYPNVSLKISLASENADSSLPIMMFAAGADAEVALVACGPHKQALALLDELETFFDNNFAKS
ncbi:MAG: HPr family phosphocarrier protein [Puniceicoccales bacterium]|jgi:phosphotransferase system HPr (HPr) family protein|nr:HPr family phosphocarrier protein [Puniceicoccales bacterium]